MKRLIAALGALAVAALLFTGCATTTGGGSDPSPVTTTAAPAPSHTPAPPGFLVFEGGAGIAYQWLTPDDPENDCAVSVSAPDEVCSVAKVFATIDCDGIVHAEANVLNESETVIGSTERALGRLKAGQTGLMRLTTLEPSAATFELTAVTCELPPPMPVDKPPDPEGG